MLLNGYNRWYNNRKHCEDYQIDYIYNIEKIEIKE